MGREKERGEKPNSPRSSFPKRRGEPPVTSFSRRSGKKKEKRASTTGREKGEKKSSACSLKNPSSLESGFFRPALNESKKEGAVQDYWRRRGKERLNISAEMRKYREGREEVANTTCVERLIPFCGREAEQNAAGKERGGSALSSATKKGKRSLSIVMARRKKKDISSSRDGEGSIPEGGKNHDKRALSEKKKENFFITPAFRKGSLGNGEVKWRREKGKVQIADRLDTEGRRKAVTISRACAAH